MIIFNSIQIANNVAAEIYCARISAVRVINLKHQSTMLTSWTTIKDLPLIEYYPCKINDEEYLIFSSSLSIMQTNGITKYNAITNKFTKLVYHLQMIQGSQLLQFLN